MRLRSILLAISLIPLSLSAQQAGKTTANNYTGSTSATDALLDSSNNVNYIKHNYLFNVLHNPNDVDDENDNDLSRFNRWFHDVQIRTYPTGFLPRPDVLIRETEKLKTAAKNAPKHKTTAAAWSPLGPMKVPTNFNGIGRVNAIVIDPTDTNTLYVGAACGGVFISHDGGTTWTSNSDFFPSLSIADIVVNPRHHDTIYAATGDGYGYENDAYQDFWGGLYSAGVMMSPDGGNTWQTTGLSYLQTDKDIIQKLLISPNNPNIVLAGARTGLMRTTDAGATWTNVLSGHIYSMAFRPGQPDTVYAMTNYDLKVSYDAGATWQMLNAGINPSNSRATLAVCPLAPNSLWLLDASDALHHSHNSGGTFTTTNPPDTAFFYGYYDRVLAISSGDSNLVYAFGELMSYSPNAGAAWYRLNPTGNVHVDNHAIAINPLHPATIYTGNDGGISVSRNGGQTWKNISSGLTISQIYRISTSQQNPNIMICGLQDNGSMTYNGTNWMERTGGDGEDNGICPSNDFVQISSSQNGNFNVSYDQGLTFSYLNFTSEAADWTAPVVFDPNSASTVYFGYKNIWRSIDNCTTFSNISGTALFPNGATAMAISPSSSNVLYASDLSHIFRTTNWGATWTNVTGNLPSNDVAISRIAVDFKDSMRVYVTLSGYLAPYKVFTSATGGTSWTSIGTGLPNLPVNCISVDSSTPGGLFVGTDIGVYYTDSTQSGWSLYGTGLPNVIANDLDINYTNYKIRVATYGRGVWEAPLVHPLPNGVSQISAPTSPTVQVFPNPTRTSWRLVFQNKLPASYSVRISDALGREVFSGNNTSLIDATTFEPGIYAIEVSADGFHEVIKATRD